MTSCTPVKLAFSLVEPQNGASGHAPIIFAHGLSGSKEHWEDLSQTFADRTQRKVYSIDARNHGDSEWNDVFNFDVNVVDLLHFMDTHSIPKAILVGHSMGGVTAIKTALVAPDRVEKVVVEDMSAKGVPPEAVAMVSGLMTILKNAIALVPPHMEENEAKQMVFASFMAQIPEEVKNVVKPESFKNLKIQLKRLDDGRLTFKANMDVLEKTLKDPDNVKPTFDDVDRVYAGPASFIYGKLSPFQVGSDEAAIRKLFPNAQFSGIENATHSVHFDCPEEFTETVLDFILKE